METFICQISNFNVFWNIIRWCYWGIFPIKVKSKHWPPLTLVNNFMVWREPKIEYPLLHIFFQITKMYLRSKCNRQYKLRVSSYVMYFVKIYQSFLLVHDTSKIGIFPDKDICKQRPLPRPLALVNLNGWGATKPNLN